MDFDFNSAEGGLRYDNGVRYTLKVTDASEGESKVKFTPYVRLKLSDENGNDAYSVDIWNTPKALFIAALWFKALGLKDEGNVSVNTSVLRGITLTAVCKHESYLDGNGKERKAIRWEDPLPVSYGEAASLPGDLIVDDRLTGEEAAAALAPKKPKVAKKTDKEDVPF